MGAFLLRMATRSDCGAMMELIKELAIFEKEPEAVTVSLAEFELCGFGPEAIWKAFVAESDQGIVGMSLFYPRYSTWKGRKLYLEDIVVKESFRSQGIGQLLFDATLDYAKVHQYHSLYWQVLNWNEGAIRFYERNGATFDGEWFNASLEL